MRFAISAAFTKKKKKKKVSIYRLFEFVCVYIYNFLKIYTTAFLKNYKKCHLQYLISYPEVM